MNEWKHETPGTKPSVRGVVVAYRGVEIGRGGLPLLSTGAPMDDTSIEEVVIEEKNGLLADELRRAYVYGFVVSCLLLLSVALNIVLMLVLKGG